MKYFTVFGIIFWIRASALSRVPQNSMNLSMRKKKKIRFPIGDQNLAHRSEASTGSGNPYNSPKTWLKIIQL